MGDPVSTLRSSVFWFFSEMPATVPNRIWDYRALAAKVLIVSIMPDIGLVVLHGFDGGWPEVLALLVMHVAIWAIGVTVLLAFTMTCTGPDSAIPPRITTALRKTENWAPGCSTSIRRAASWAKYDATVD
jgi:hypothetical protein